MGVNKDMPANIASADMYDMLVDTDGTVWVRLASGAWSYLSSLTELSWDVHHVLPDLYEPYRPLDEHASALLTAAIADICAAVIR